MKNIVVAGGGVLGSQIAYQAAYCGFNVTIPYKEKVMSYLDNVSPEARAIGAVNVVKVTEKDGKKVIF